MRLSTHAGRFAAFAVVTGMGLGVAQAEITLFHDDFSDGNRDGWWKFVDDQVRAEVVDASGGLGTGNALELDFHTSSGSHGVLNHFGDVTLSEVGDYVTLSFDAWGGEEMNDQSRAFQFGLFDLDTADMASDADWNSSREGRGYHARIDIDRVSGRATLRQQPETWDPFSTSEANDSLADTNNPEFDEFDDTKFGVVSDEVRNFALTIERIGPNDDDMRIALAVDGGDPFVTELSGEGFDMPTDTFTTIAIGTRGHAGSQILVDNVSVTSNIPEPGTLGLLGLGGLVMLGRRRRAPRVA